MRIAQVVPTAIATVRLRGVEYFVLAPKTQGT